MAGGGPAGMEAARVASLRGHNVLLYEKESELGGQLLLASIPPHKEEIENVAGYLKTQLEKLRVKIVLGEEVSQGIIDEIRPDAVIIATGAVPAVPPIPGIKRNNVFIAREVLLGKAVAEPKDVIVIGGGMVGVETAEFLAEIGKEVTIIEMLERVAEDLGPVARMFQKKRLAQKGVKILTGTKVKEIKENGVMAQRGGESIFVPAGSIVIAVGATPDRKLAALLADNIPAYIVGDSAEAGDIMNGIHDGSLIARKL
ncbi:MAG: FAD-dependent oxidoreductase [Syntrophales bacterium]|nr:FAD-dependent oxidoreductase [Syntrophales bacterium]